MMLLMRKILVWISKNVLLIQIFEQSPGGEVLQAVRDAIDVGYRHFDTAYFYGNESEVGQAIREKIAEGVVKREDVFFVTKLWCTFHSPVHVERILRKSLANTGLDYIDLYLIHFPMAMKYESDEKLMPTLPDGSFDVE